MLKALEKKLRLARDRIIRPFAVSDHVMRHSIAVLDTAVWDCGDHLMAFDPKDRVIGSAIRKERGYCRPQTMRVFDALPRGGTFVDVGANIGTQTVYALMFGGFDRAVCFEPHPKNVRLLKTNMLINGLQDRVTIIEAAAGRESGTAALYIEPQNSGGHSLAINHNGASISVPVVQVESTLASLGVSDIGLAWIDVEGHEGEVLAGWPSLSGAPLCIEYCADVSVLPKEAFAGWSKWANVRENLIRWQPIVSLDVSSYSNQADLLLT